MKERPFGVSVLECYSRSFHRFHSTRVEIPPFLLQSPFILLHQLRSSLKWRQFCATVGKLESLGFACNSKSIPPSDQDIFGGRALFEYDMKVHMADSRSSVIPHDISPLLVLPQNFVECTVAQAYRICNLVVLAYRFEKA